MERTIREKVLRMRAAWNQGWNVLLPDPEKDLIYGPNPLYLKDGSMERALRMMARKGGKDFASLFPEGFSEILSQEGKLLPFLREEALKGGKLDPDWKKAFLLLSERPYAIEVFLDFERFYYQQTEALLKALGLQSERAYALVYWVVRELGWPGRMRIAFKDNEPESEKLKSLAQAILQHLNPRTAGRAKGPLEILSKGRGSLGRNYDLEKDFGIRYPHSYGKDLEG